MDDSLTDELSSRWPYIVESAATQCEHDTACATRMTASVNVFTTAECAHKELVLLPVC